MGDTHLKHADTRPAIVDYLQNTSPEPLHFSLVTFLTGNISSPS